MQNVDFNCSGESKDDEKTFLEDSGCRHTTAVENVKILFVMGKTWGK